MEGVITTIPDAIEPIRGARAWKVARNVAGLTVLRGYGVGVSWKRATVQADCKKDDPFIFPMRAYGIFSTGTSEPKHDAPHPKCSCGFWAFADPLDLPDAPVNRDENGRAVDTPVDWVVGVVELWGRVVCGTDGWRGEWARIAGLVPVEDEPSPLEKQVAEVYRVPILEAWPSLSEPTPKEEADGHRGDPEDDRDRAAGTVTTTTTLGPFGTVVRS